MRSFLSLLLIVTLMSSCNSKVKKTQATPEKSKEFNAAIGNITDFKTITFKSKDGLDVTADLYIVENPKDYILLCHQAGFSRGEYIETAKKLNNIGYSCIAIDQRSGKVVNNVINKTASLAIEKGVKVEKYEEAKPDIEAAIDYTYKMNNSKPIIIVGSSYSASLSLLLATSNDKIKAVAAFSPGEYLKGIDLTNSIEELNKPVFVTSSNKEINDVTNLISKVKSKNKNQFKPAVKGIHGSRVLWKKTKGHENYWKSFIDFLNSVE